MNEVDCLLIWVGWLGVIDLCNLCKDDFVWNCVYELFGSVISVFVCIPPKNAPFSLTTKHTNPSSTLQSSKSSL